MISADRLAELIERPSRNWGYNAIMDAIEALRELQSLRATQAQSLTDAQIVEIRDDHLPSQGEPFDCIAFARAVLAARPQKQAREVEVCPCGENSRCVTPNNPNCARLLRATQSRAQQPVNEEGPPELGPQPAPGFHFDARGVLVADSESPAPSTPAQEGESTREQIDAGWVADLAYEDELKNAGYTHADRRERVRRILRAARLLRATQSNGRLPENPATGRLQHRPNVARSTGSESGSAGCDATGGQIDGELPATIHALERAARYVGRLDPTLEGNESADGDAERLLELVERLRQSPAQSAPAQEPVGEYIVSEAGVRGVAWNANVALPSARGPLYAAPPPPAPAQEPVATLEAKVSTLLARALTTGYGSTEAIYALANLAREPLYAAPPPDEARALLKQAINVRGVWPSQLVHDIRAFLASK